MRLYSRSRILIGVAAALLVTSAIIFFIADRLNRTVSSERERRIAASRMEVEARDLRAPSTDGLTLYLNSSDVRAVASFQGVRYLATSGGLIALDDEGNVDRRYTTLDGLPESELTALSVFHGRMFIGTSSAGVLAFDGNSFTGYRFNKPKATHVSVLVATESELLIGTLDGGMFEYDGERFTRRDS